LKGNKPEVYGGRNSAKAEPKKLLAFKGTMEDLLVSYRNLTLGPPVESEQGDSDLSDGCVALFARGTRCKPPGTGG
jgi:hypothetical protein